MTTESPSTTDERPTHSAMHHHGVQEEPPGGSPSAAEPLPRPLHVPILLAACVSAASFAAGVWVGGCRLEARVREAADVRMLEFVQYCDRIGVLDRAGLEEALVTASEAEWEDRDADERGVGGGQ